MARKSRRKWMDWARPKTYSPGQGYDVYGGGSWYETEYKRNAVKESNAKELKEYLELLKAKEDKETIKANSVIAALVDKWMDKYSEFGIDEVKKYITFAQKCGSMVVLTEILRAGPDLIKACAEEWQLNNLVELGTEIIETDMRTGIAFIRKSSELIKTDRNIDIKGWAERGMEQDDNLAYFKGESKTSQSVLGLSKLRVVQLATVAGSFRCFARAISGKPMLIEQTDGAVRTDGTVIYLPPKEEEFPTKDMNRKKLRVLTAHEARHGKESFFMDLSKLDNGKLMEIAKLAHTEEDDLKSTLEGLAEKYDEPFTKIMETFTNIEKSEIEEELITQLLEIREMKETEIRKKIKEMKGMQEKAEYIASLVTKLGIDTRIGCACPEKHCIKFKGRVGEDLPQSFNENWQWETKDSEGC